MIHGPLLLHVLSQRYSRIIATHICFTSTRIYNAPTTAYQCTDYRMSYYCYHHSMDYTEYCDTCMYCFYLLVIWLIVHITCIIPCYPCIPLIWLFYVTDMDFPLLDMSAVDMRHVESHIYCSRFMLYCSRFIVPVSRYIVLCYHQSSGPVIMLPVSCTVFVLVTWYTWHIKS